MANYFNETEVKAWNIIQYHKNWISTYKEDPIKLTYNKASDNLLKTLRNIVDKSLDSTKIRKACELLLTSKARIIILYFVVLQDKSLHMNFLSSQQGGTAIRCSSDGLFVRCVRASGDSK